MPGSASETRRPPSGAPCHLQDLTRSGKGLKRSGDLFDLPVPFFGQFRASIVAAAPLPPLVVLGRTSSIVRSLLGEESIVAHWQKSLTSGSVPGTLRVCPEPTV